MEFLTQKRLKRREYCKEWRKNQRQKLRAEHRCIWCKKKVKPIITYPQFCKEHNQKNRNKLKEQENDRKRKM